MIKFSVVDAFTRTPFQGNQAAVCLLKNPLRDEQMQRMAMELNYSETVFLEQIEGKKNHFSIRWFTPTVEVDICGHATVAAAHMLWEEGHLGHGEPLYFHSKDHGELHVTKRDSYICMDFPSFECEEYSEIRPEWKEMFPGAVFMGSSHDTMVVEFETGEMVETFKPDFNAISKLKEHGLMIVAKSHKPQVDFVNRCFFPKVGINEDPVTGSAYCTLAPYWMNKTGLSHVMGEQVSKRTGRVHVERGEGDRLIISGQAVTTFKGIMTASL